jgi:CheY-like chemotaxis protein
MVKPRLLVADDHTEMRARIATLLRSEFDVVATVANGQEAVDATRTLLPDLVVLDIAMPVLNGFEAAAIIKDFPDAPRIVFCTASDDPDFARAARALGASACVLKRKLLVELVSMVRRALKVHAVYFYEDAESLAHTVARFIGAGLIANQSAVLIATPSHRAAILEQLIAMAVEPQKRIDQGELVMLDADEVLSRFMVEATPDTRRFEDTMMHTVMDRLAWSGTRTVRAYGEMVDLLWKNDQHAAAISLETLWNQFIASRKCSLLCGYSFEAVGEGTGFKKICSEHSHVVSAGHPLPPC